MTLLVTSMATDKKKKRGKGQGERDRNIEHTLTQYTDTLTEHSLTHTHRLTHYRLHRPAHARITVRFAQTKSVTVSILI